MNFTCRNCKNRNTYDCEDYNWGYWDTKACRDRFSLDFETLSPKERENMTNIAKAIFTLEGNQ